MENSILLAVEIVFTETGIIPTDEAKKEIAENVLNALLSQEEKSTGLAPRYADFKPLHIYVKDYLTGGREIKFVHSF